VGFPEREETRPFPTTSGGRSGHAPCQWKGWDDSGGEASRDGWWLDGEPVPGVISFFGLVAPAAVMALLVGSCGGGGSSGGGPTTPPSASAPPPSGTNPTVTITAAGAVSPKNIDDFQGTVTVRWSRLLQVIETYATATR
jgi:hypothetical protein